MVMGEPSRKVNVNNSNGQGSNANNGKGTSGAVKPTPGRLPNLMEDERTLLYNNNSCLKCRRPFMEHCMNDCLNGFPDGNTYRMLTQAAVDALCPRMGHVVAAMNGVPESPTTPSLHLIAAVISSSRNPVAYMPANQFSVLEKGDDSESDDSVSCTSDFACTPAVCAVQTKGQGEAPLPKAVTEKIDLFEPHLIWSCEIAGPALDFPLITDSMLDTVKGIHAVYTENQQYNYPSAPTRASYPPLCPTRTKPGHPPTHVPCQDSQRPLFVHPPPPGLHTNVHSQGVDVLTPS
jgi:hypothetical protein